MSGKNQTLFVPWGELKPDGRLFNNDGLITAVGVAPVYGNYVGAQIWQPSGDEPTSEPYGLHIHPLSASTWKAYVGSTKLEEFNTSFVKTDKTRLVGGNYTPSGTGGEAGWNGVSFGDAVIMTNYVDDPQLLTSNTAANFVKLASSGGGNPGMDPKAKFVFPVRNNLALANLNLSAGFDTLSSGANPTTVAWSQTDNVRQYGSYNITPQLVGTGYQSLNYDIGEIKGAVGGDYGLIAMRSGWVRMDGPPYTFRPISVGQGCKFPKSIIRFDDDVYFWGPSGPSVFRGGDGTPEVLGDGKIARTLIDNTTGFSSTYSIYQSIAVRHVSADKDVANGLIYWSYTTTAGGTTRTGDTCLIYNVRDGRFSFMDNGTLVTSDSGPFNTGVIFLRSRPDGASTWAPGRDLVGIFAYVDLALTPRYFLAAPVYAAATPPYSWGGAVPTLARAYQQYDENYTTRILRVRPIYSRNDGSNTALTATVTVSSKNKPYESPRVSTPVWAVDTHGWTPITDSVYADFHQVTVAFQANDSSAIAEFEGFEVEFTVSGRYSA